MLPPRILIIYGSNYGQTAKVADRIRAHLTARGLVVTAQRGDTLSPDLAPGAFDAIVVGASLIGGRYQRCIRRFVDANHAALLERPSAFFAVSGSAASAEEGDRAEARRLMEVFLAKAGWRPRLRASFGGAMAYTKYNFFLRWMTRLVSSRRGGPTDTSRDHEFTNWADVERFAAEIGTMVPAVEPALVG